MSKEDRAVYCKKLSAALTGKRLTPQHRYKLSVSLTGRTQSEETRARRSESLKRFYAEHPEAGKRMSEERRGRTMPAGALAKTWATRRANQRGAE